MTPVLGDPQANFECVRAWTAEAALRGSQLILFPELWSTGGDLPHWEQHAAVLGAGMFAAMAELALEFRIALGGSILERRDGRAYNTFAMYGNNGEQLGVYRKLHLFQLMDEHKWLAAGDAPAMLGAEWGQSGLAICYDLRFGELFRGYALAGAELALLPALWPAVRRAHWSTLLRARAIENQMFMAAVNCAGRVGNTEFGGASAVVGPWGDGPGLGGAPAGPLPTGIVLDLGREGRP
ncbi:MAG: carbon-nitrogen family hydrolase, partial [Chloroflexi bacterium]